MNYQLAAELIYKFYYGSQKINNYNEVINELKSFLCKIVHEPWKCMKSKDFKINFEYFIIKPSHAEEIKTIIIALGDTNRLITYKPLPLMYMFDDDDVHFDNEIYSKNKGVFKNKSLEEIFNQETFNDLELTCNNQPMKVDKLVINKEFINTGYGKNKIRILPGDWLVMDKDKVSLINYHNAHVNKVTCDMTPSPHPETLFKREQVEFVARWWAGFLPGIEESKVNKFNNKCKIWLKDKHKEVGVSTTQYDKFVNYLIEHMYLEEIKISNNKHYNYPYYIKWGRLGEYRHPSIVDEALQATNIKLNSNWGLFPFRSEMKIYNIGLVIFNDEVIYSLPKLNLYNEKNLDFTKAPLMRFIGHPFKIVEIKWRDRYNDLYEKEEHDEVKEVNIIKKVMESKLGSGAFNENTIIYAKIEKKCFKNSSKNCEEYTNEELVNILQIPDLISEIFEPTATICYKIKLPELLTDRYCTVSSSPKLVSPGYYKYFSKPLKVIKIAKDGVIVKVGRPNFLKAGDFIYQQTDDEYISYLRAHNDPYGFAAYLYDAARKAISDIPHYPSNPEVPLLGGYDVESSM